MTPSPLGVGTFGWQVTPSSELAVQRGATASFQIRLNSKVNINAEVGFSVSGTLPQNITVTFSPARLPSTGRDATLTIQTTSQTPEGAYSFNIIATEDGQTPVMEARRLDVVSGTGPDFTVEVNPAETVISRFPSPTISYYVRPRNGFQGTVNISVESAELPPPVLLVQAPDRPQLVYGAGSGGQGGTFVVSLAERASYPATATVTVRATSGSIVHTRDIVFTIRVLSP
jgi:hypothetical protein